MLTCKRLIRRLAYLCKCKLLVLDFPDNTRAIPKPESGDGKKQETNPNVVCVEQFESIADDRTIVDVFDPIGMPLSHG